MAGTLPTRRVTSIFWRAGLYLCISRHEDKDRLGVVRQEKDCRQLQQREILSVGADDLT